ncbi:polyketide cyclase [Rhodanobacter lindaniclasticus]|uniref:Polyketide cyclase n=1 Tax=Rhodanobacter lindaniclasticus TaxID=75310 RepID=A0A4S3KHA5_9GAMM|nr:polyketide cyclase [Rhodanobacter lindaniclasticus]THD08043.1 polyketide cyclase [Rhodanobacter lindaniclasticus]
MMRVFEFLVALVIVAVIGVVAGVVMPSSGHVERSQVVGKDMRQVYDLLNNFRRFPDYSVLRSQDSGVQFKFSGKAYGPGAEISWTSTDPKLGDGGLTIASATPQFDQIDSNTQDAAIIWNLDNNWRGLDKHFTLDLERQGHGRLTQITWSYDVQYGWNLINRFANLYIHGDPDSFIQFSLNNLQNVLAGVANVDYSDLMPRIAQSQPTPVLFVTRHIDRSKGGSEVLDDILAQSDAELRAQAKKLGVNVTGPSILFITNYGDPDFDFDVALPIDSSTLTINGQSEQLTAPVAPSLDAAAAAEPAPSASAAAAAAAAATAGTRDRFGNLVVEGDVRAMMAFGGATLQGVWEGTFNGVPQTVKMLTAYAQTHGYQFDSTVNPPYDIVVTPEVKDSTGAITSYARHQVSLPLTNAPAQTPEQEAGLLPSEQNGAPAAGASAPAPAGSSAPAEPASAGE